ncbi:MAG: hypothetical protein SFU87_08475 [Chitinophagaceae bacterium]|nr:hypothetical protein [Chitinophagaceae bacterium]
MKFILPSLLFFLCLNPGTAQEKTGKDRKDKYGDFFKPHIIELKTDDTTGLSGLQFSGITIWDKRADASKIGFYKGDKSSNNSFKKIITKETLPQSLKDFFDTAFQDKYNIEKGEILLVIRRLHFNMDYEYAPQVRKFEEIENPYYLLSIKFDFFLKTQNNCVAIKQVDSIISFNYKNKSKDKGTLIGAPILSIIKYLNQSNISELTKNRKAYTTENLNQFYATQTQFPINTDTSLKKGIYKTFTEFRQNNPSITNYIFKNKKKIDELYEITNSDTILIRKIWGLCDGKNIYVKSGNQFYLLHKQHGTYEVLTPLESFNPVRPHNYPNSNLRTDNDGVPGTLSAADITLAMARNALSLININMSTPLFPFQLDMETGEFH